MFKMQESIPLRSFECVGGEERSWGGTDFMNLKLLLNGEEVRIAAKPIWVIAFVTSEAREVFMVYSGKMKMALQQWRGHLSARGFAS